MSENKEDNGDLNDGGDHTTDNKDKDQVKDENETPQEEKPQGEENKGDLEDKPVETAFSKEDDEILNLFFEEINSIGKLEYDNKKITLDPNQICLRLTSQSFANPFQVLQLKHDASDEEIKQRYYKLSLLIHPDKCSNEKAPQAFQVLKDAYNEIKKEDIREKYKEVYEEAKRTVYRRNKVDPNLSQLELFSMGISVDLKSLEKQIEKECENILAKQKERREYAENCIKANIQYEKNIQSKIWNLEREKLNQQVEWDKTRDLRVNSWKSFQSKNASKEANMFKVPTKKEELGENMLNTKSINLIQSDRINKRRKIANSELYKSTWK